VPLREPEPAPEGCSRLLQPERTDDKDVWNKIKDGGGRCREVFAGRGGLSRSLTRAGLSVDSPLEAYPEKCIYLPAQDLGRPEVVARFQNDIAAGCYFYVHFGSPCSSWSSLRRLSGGTRRKGFEAGDLKDEKEVLGNHLADVVSRLCRRTHETGGGAFLYREPERLVRVGLSPHPEPPGHVVTADFDQSMFGLTRPLQKTEPRHVIDKETCSPPHERAFLEALGRSRDHVHRHLECMGSVTVGGRRVSVASSAGEYPGPLCEAWAAAIVSQARAAGQQARGEKT
jgi:hypothetical protein